MSKSVSFLPGIPNRGPLTTSRSHLLRLLFATVVGVGIPASTFAQCVVNDNLWNLRENGDDRFHSNEAYVRPWRFNYDDGLGRWVGNYSYEIPWTDMGTSGNGTGAFQISRPQDRQFSAWTFVYLEQAGNVRMPDGNCDCVTRVFMDFGFDSEHGTPFTFGPLSAGWHRIDLTGYNQNSGYSGNFPRPEGITYMSHALPAVCAGDTNRDCMVNFADITAVLEHFGMLYSPKDLNSTGDANHDGIVTFADVTHILTHWGSGCS